MLCYSQVAPTIPLLLLPCIPLSPFLTPLPTLQLSSSSKDVLLLPGRGVGQPSVPYPQYKQCDGSRAPWARGQPCCTRGCRFVPHNETQP